MDFDFTTKAGFQKFFAFALTMAVEVLAMFGLPQAKLDIAVQLGAILVPVLAMIGFFIVNQIAATGKAKAEIAKINATAAAITLTGNTPAVAPAAPPPAAVAVVTVGTPPAPPAPVPVVTPFNEAAFMDEVNKTVTARYTVANPSTIFYNAEQVYRDWKYDNDQAMKDARALLLKLADTAFKSIWGASYRDAWTFLNDPLGRGCPTCPDTQKGCTYPDLKYKARQLGMNYYTALLDYERIELIQ